MLRCAGLAAGYDPRIPIVRGITIDISSGEYWAVVGPNGCGKTAFLKTMVGILEPLEGRVEWGASGVRPRIGYVPQRDTIDPLYPLEVREIVALAAGTAAPWRLRPSRADFERVDHSLERVGLAAKADRGYGELSGGERQRVLLARALALEPEVLALDEPTSQLDPGSTERILDLVEGVKRESGLTVLLVSHDLSLVARRASHAIAIVNGRWASGRADEVLTSERLSDLYETPMRVVRDEFTVSVVPGRERVGPP